MMRSFTEDQILAGSSEVMRLIVEPGRLFGAIHEHSRLAGWRDGMMREFKVGRLG
jgi:hypothetical protein